MGPFRLRNNCLSDQSEAPHFCHPETSRISLTREGSMKYNDYGKK